MRNQLEACHNLHIVKNRDCKIVCTRWYDRFGGWTGEINVTKETNAIKTAIIGRSNARHKNVTWWKMMAAIRMQKSYRAERSVFNWRPVYLTEGAFKCIRVFPRRHSRRLNLFKSLQRACSDPLKHGSQPVARKHTVFNVSR